MHARLEYLPEIWDKVDALERDLKDVRKQVRGVDAKVKAAASAGARQPVVVQQNSAPPQRQRQLAPEPRGEVFDPEAMQKEIMRQVRERVDKTVGRAVAKAVEASEARLAQGFSVQIDALLKTVTIKHGELEKQLERSKHQAAASSRPQGGNNSGASAGVEQLHTRIEQVHNHTESYLRHHQERSDDFSRRVDTVELRLREVSGRGGGALDSDELDSRLVAVETLLEAVQHSQDQDTDTLLKQIAELHALSDATARGAAEGRLLDVAVNRQETGISGGALQEQREEADRSKKAVQRLEQHQFVLEKKLEKLLENPALASTLAAPESPDSTAAAAATTAAAAPPVGPLTWSDVDAAGDVGWAMVEGSGVESSATPAAVRALELQVTKMRRDTDRCQELLKFCSSRLNLRSVRAIRVERSADGRSDEMLAATGPEWKMALVPGVPVKRQVKGKTRAWKTADWKPPRVVNAAKVAGAFEPHGSVAKARAQKTFRGVSKARANGSTQRLGPTLRDMFAEAKALGMAEIAIINQEIGEAREQSIAETEARVELQTRLRENEARVEELEGAMADEQERSLLTDKTQRALGAAVEELSGWRERASDIDRQLAGVSDRCHQTAAVVADQQLGMKALETLIDDLPAGGVVAVQDSEPRAAFQPGADWLKDAAEMEDARRLLQFVVLEEGVARGGGGGDSASPSAWAPLSPGGAAKQRGADHLARLQSRLDRAIGSDDASKVVSVLRDAAVVEADESSLIRPDHTFVTSLTALRNHAVTLCE